MGNIVEHLDTRGFLQTQKQCKNGITAFQSSVQKMKSATRRLLENWEGEGRKEFEYQFLLLSGRFDDLEEELCQIYEELVDAETVYLDADEEMGKVIKMAEAQNG